VTDTTDTTWRFVHAFRAYQHDMLECVAAKLALDPEASAFHLVAPPGAGKTIVGLELIGRFDAPAVVFAPTSTIQHQWVDKAGLFTPTSHTVTSTDPTALSRVNVFTYQLISVAGDANAMLEDAAAAEWASTLVADRVVDDDVAATDRIATMKTANPNAYKREIRTRVQRLRRKALRGEAVDVEQWLHPNARRLIDDLAAAGVSTVVLDECHHLLDYWAIVIAALIARLNAPRVIGLTATLPSTDDDNEYANYTGLLGDVDYVVPVPAIVREGGLAPYRDLAAFTHPLEDERAHLEDARMILDAEITATTADARYATWLFDAAFMPGDSPAERWNAALRTDMPIAVAALRTLKVRGMDLPGVIVPASASTPPTFDDTLMLVERYTLRTLKLSADEADHARLTTLKKALRGFGMNLTESGLRQSRALGDLLVSHSGAKAQMAATILGREHADMGDELRAVVVTDYEVTGVKIPGDPKGFERGSARHTFLTLVAHPDSHYLDPVLVTGKSFWLDADHHQERVRAFNAWLAGQGLDAQCEAVVSGHDGVVEIDGTGKDWTSGTYVRMVTAMLETRVLTCLVGTRALFAEGWDALTLNTFIDLTAVATSTTTQQMRGRAIRIDPQRPRKVAHQWDVICVDTTDPRGLSDLARLDRRHRHVWGTIPPAKGVAMEDEGRIVAGLRHVDPPLVSAAFSAKDALALERTLARSTKRSLDAVGTREATYDRWRVGEPYDGQVIHAALIEPPEKSVLTVHTVLDTLRALGFALRWALLVTAVSVAAQALGVAVRGVPLSVVVATAALGLAFQAVRTAWPLARKVLKGDSPDTALLDMGRAVADALAETGLIAFELGARRVRVGENEDLSLVVYLQSATDEDGEIFATAMAELLTPVSTQRYLVHRDEADLPNMWMQPIWKLLRTALRQGDVKPFYHPVPGVLAQNKERAETFANRWRVWVGGGDLVYTRAPEGYAILEQARADAGVSARTSAYDMWR